MKENKKQLPGLGLVISIGKWGGIYIARDWTTRLCLGWVAITFLPADGDFLLRAAEKATNMGEALVELLYRNPQRHDGHAYELRLALWGLGIRKERPDPLDFSQEPVDMDKARELVVLYASDEEE